MIKIFVYLFTNKINNKKYVGITTLTLRERMYCHKNQVKGKGLHKPLYKSINKHGWDSFNIEVIDTAESIEDLHEKEKYYIKKYNTYVLDGKGYNLTFGGEGCCGQATSAKGEDNPHSKLTEYDVKQIKMLLELTHLQDIQIAELFKVSKTSVRFIRLERTWSTVEVKDNDVLDLKYVELVKKYNKSKKHILMFDGILKKQIDSSYTAKELVDKYNIAHSRIGYCLKETKKGNVAFLKRFTFIYEYDYTNEWLQLLKETPVYFMNKVFEGYDKNGNLIGTWSDKNKCVEDLNLHSRSGLYSCLEGKQKKYKDYIFKYIQST